jgi:ribosome-associated translation inhibitor RaiA
MSGYLPRTARERLFRLGLYHSRHVADLFGSIDEALAALERGARRWRARGYVHVRR